MSSPLLGLKSQNRGFSQSLGQVNIIIPGKDGVDDPDGGNSTPSNYYSLNAYSAAVLFEVFLYGIYSTLFALCVRILLRNKRSTQKLLLACAAIMFALATVDVVLEISFLFWFVVKANTIPQADVHFKYLIYITSNLIADSLVIYRCYTVWNRSKRVIILPLFLLLCGSALGYGFIAVSKEDYRFRQLLIAFLFTTVSLNLLVTVLMSGRIWWIARKARSILGPGLTSKYTTMIAIIVESGVIYSIYFILDVVAQNLILDAGLAQVVGIVPTLIIVQIGLGRDAHDIDEGTTATMVRTDGTRAFNITRTSTNDHDYANDPPPGSPPMSDFGSPTISIPPSTFSGMQQLQQTSLRSSSRLYDLRRMDSRKTEEDVESGYS
ncbi:hypothetical protein CPC08DRAFT_688585 [Agrocybe pediades]|nr:hypothetical protein CPC08DRAFT_688585 [Agrocybe pediades]